MESDEQFLRSYVVRLEKELSKHLGREETLDDLKHDVDSSQGTVHIPPWALDSTIHTPLLQAYDQVIEQLTANLDNCRDQFESLQKVYEQTKGQILEHAEEHSKQPHYFFEELKQRVDMLNEDRDVLSSLNHALTTDNTKLTEKLEKSQTKCRELENELSIAKEELDKVRDECAETLKEKMKLSIQESEEYQKKDEEIERLREDSQSVIDSMEKLESLLTQYKMREMSLLKSKQKLINDLGNAQIENDKLNEQCRLFTLTVTELRKKIMDEQDERNNQERDLTNKHRNQCKIFENERNGLTAEIHQLRLKMNNLKSNMETANQECNLKSTLITQLSNDINQLKLDLSKMTNESMRKQDTIDELSDKINELNESINFEQELKQRRDIETDKIASEMTHLNQEKDRLTAELEVIKEQSEKEREEREEAIAKLEANCTACEKQWNERVMIERDLNARHTEEKKVLEEMNQRMKQEMDRLRESVNEAENVKDQANKLHRTVKELELSNDRLKKSEGVLIQHNSTLSQELHTSLLEIKRLQRSTLGKTTLTTSYQPRSARTFTGI